MAEQVQTKEEGAVSRAFSTVVFWWLTTMGTVTLALAATIPMWTEYKQVVQVRDQLQQQVSALHKRVDRNNYFIKAYTEDPEAIDMLAVSNLRYRRPDETVMPLPSQIMAQVRPIGWDSDVASGDSSTGSSKSAEKSNAARNSVERFVERTKGISRHYLGPARSIALVEMFCDNTCRNALTAGALAVLAAALFLCKPSPTGKQ